MKRFFALLTAVMLLFSLAACGSTEQPTATESLPSTSADMPPVLTTAAKETAQSAEESRPIFACEEDRAAFELLGDYTAEHSAYPNRHVELHVSGKDWELSEDYELFRKYFFGAWEKDGQETPLVIDDSESAWFAKNCHSDFFMDFYKVGEDVLVFQTGGSAGGTLYWLDKNEPETLYGADGAPGGSPNGIIAGEDGFPHVGVLHKNDTAPNEPANNYLSVFRLREMAQKHGIDYGLLVDVELEAVPWTGHDSKYYFYPMYLVSEADDRIEIATQAGDVYSYTVDIGILLEKADGEWVRTVEAAEEFSLTGSAAYQLIGVYWDDENGICADFGSIPTPEDYDLFRQYFFGVWDSPDGYLPRSLTLDDSENLNFAGRGYFGEFYQPGDRVIAFTLLTNADAHVFWLDMDNPDVMYAAPCSMENNVGCFTYREITSDAHILKRNAAAPGEPADEFLSIFKLHEMAHNYGMDFDLLTKIDCGMIDGIYYLHSAAYDFYPMYLVSEADGKIVIRTTVGNFGETDIEPIHVICTFEKADGEWVRTVAFDTELNVRES